MEIITLRVSLPLKLGTVNCYLIKTETGNILIDTGSQNHRIELEHRLENNGVDSENLKLIIITHGDFDHIGNAAYLRQKFAAPLAMHADDMGMAEHGDMFFNRTQPNVLVRKLLPMFAGFGKQERFVPDLLLADGEHLDSHGIHAQVISLPGHSKGSIGIWLADGNLFCGDLLENRVAPAVNAIMDDISEAQASIEKIKQLNIHTIFPGHGEPIPWNQNHNEIRIATA